MLDKLIEEGENVRKTCVREGMVGEFITGEEYEKWKAKCVLYMEQKHKGETLSSRFLETSKNADSDIAHFDKMMGILKAYKEFES